jgi:hypothetical protein
LVLSGVGAVNTHIGAEGIIALSTGYQIFTQADNASVSKIAVRGSLYLTAGTISKTLFVKEVNDTSSDGWSRVETCYVQALANLTTPRHNSGNVGTYTVNSNPTVGAMGSSSTYSTGQKFRFIFTTDGTARTITWDASWKLASLTAASAASVQKAIVEFTYDGAAWVETMSTGWYS